MPQSIERHPGMPDAGYWQARVAELEARVAAQERELAALRSRPDDRAEMFLTALLDLMPAGVLMAAAPTGQLVRANRRGGEIWGYPTDNMGQIGDYNFAGYHEDGTRYLPHEWPLARALATGEVVQGEEIRFRREDGVEGVIAAYAAPVRDASGETAAAALIFEDITARKRGEQTLHEKDLQLNAFLEQLPVGAGLCDLEGRYLILNTRLRAYGGAEIPSRDRRHHALWQSWDADGTPVDPSKWPGARALRGETAVPGMDFLFTAADRPPVWTRVSAAPFRSQTGAVVGAVTVIQDIDEQKRNEEARRESEARLQVALRAAPILVYHCDRDLRYTWIANQHPDYTVAAAIGRRDDEIAGSVAGVADLIAFKQQVLAAGEGRRAPITLTTRRGRETWDVTAEPLRDEQGQVVGLTVAALDVTDLVNAKEAALQAHRELVTTLERIHDQFWSVDRTGRIIYLNAAAQRLAADPQANPMGMNLWEAFPSLRATWEAHCAAALADQRPVHFEACSGADGRHYSIVAYPSVEGLSLFSRDITEQKRLEQELRLSEERFRLALDNSPIVVYTTDRELRYTWIYNSRAQYTAEEVLGKRDDEILPAASAAELMALKQQALAENVGVRRTVAVPQGEGTAYYDIAIEPLHDHAGTVTGLTVAATEITPIVRLRREREETLAWLDALFGSTPVGLAWLDRDLRFVRVNAALAAINGLPAAAHVGRTPAELLPDLHEVETIMQAWRDIVAGGDPVLGREVQGITPGTDGEVRYWSETWYPIRLNDAIIGMGVVVEDITARKSAEQALRIGEENLRVAIGYAPVSLVRVDRDLRYTWVYNQHADFRVDQMIGQRMGSVLPSAQTAGVVKNVRHVIAHGVGARMEYSADVSDGRHYFEAVAEPFRDETGEVQGAVIVAVDVTPHKELAAALRQAQEALEGQVTARTLELARVNVRLQEQIDRQQQTETRLAEVRRLLTQSHEEERIRLARELHDGPMQDLTAISFLLAALNQGLAAPLAAGLAEIQAAVSQVNGVLRGLAYDLRPPVLTSFGLRHALEGLVKQFQAQEAQLHVTFAAGEGPVPLDEVAQFACYRICQQALNNIHQHAAATQVWVWLHIRPDSVMLEIQDDGQGFDVPGDWVELARQGHLGVVGMAERADAMGGTLTVRSQPGQGTLVRVQVPIPGSTPDV